MPVVLLWYTVNAYMLVKRAGMVVNRIQSAGAVGDWEVAYRLVRYCAVAWARYPTMAIPMRGDTDGAMLSYIRSVDDTIDDAVTHEADGTQDD